MSASNAANFSARILLAFSTGVSSILLTPEHSPHQMDHHLPYSTTTVVMLQIQTAWLLQTVRMLLTVLRRTNFQLPVHQIQQSNIEMDLVIIYPPSSFWTKGYLFR